MGQWFLQCPIEGHQDRKNPGRCRSEKGTSEGLKLFTLPVGPVGNNNASRRASGAKMDGHVAWSEAPSTARTRDRDIRDRYFRKTAPWRSAQTRWTLHLRLRGLR